MISHPGNIVGAIRGPVILITLGVLFALDQMRSISFSRTWPVLIIVVGVMKLLERALFPPVVYGPYAPGTPNTMQGGGTPQ